jgi:hypothetical protein
MKRPPSLEDAAMDAVDEDMRDIVVLISLFVPKDRVFHDRETSGGVRREMQRYSLGGIVTKTLVNEDPDAPVIDDRLLRFRQRYFGDGVEDLGAAHGTGAVVQKPCIDTGFVKHVVSAAPNVMDRRRRDIAQTYRTFLARTVEMTAFLRRGHEGTWRSALGDSLALGHFLFCFYQFRSFEHEVKPT